MHRTRQDHRADPVRVLHVDDNPEFAELTAEVLEREDDRDQRRRRSGPPRRRPVRLCRLRLRDARLQRPRVPRHRPRGVPRHPFILCTEKGSEDLASEAISAGVTDYLQKGGGTDQYAVLANRVRNAVERVRAERERELERSERRYRTIAEHLPDCAVLAFDTDLRYQAAHGDTFSELQSVPEDYVGNHISEVFDGETLARKRALYEATLDGNRQRDEMAFAGRSYRVYAIPVRDREGAVCGGIVVTQDITEREDLRKKKERLEKFTSIVSHDLRNPLNVARGQAGLAREDCDSEHLDAVVRAHERMETLIDDLLVLAQSGRQIDELAPVALRTLAIDCWDGVVTDEATLETATDRRIRADRNRLRQVLKNLFRDAVVHGGSAVTVTIGQLADGFYVEDDGPGIPADDREQIFDAGYSTARDGTGFGLSIVEEIADAHDWSIRVTEGADGGARFEVTGVASADAAE